MVTKKSWEEFRKSGLLLIINQTLHIFGWAICFDFEDYNEETDTGKIIAIYPARVKFRGFDNKSVDESYIKVSKYMVENSKKLLEEAEEE